MEMQRASTDVLYSINLTLRWDPAYKRDQVYGETVAALGEVGEWWHSQVMPGHFDFAAMAKYHYRPRTKNYQLRKARQKRHQRPLVWSGRLEAAAKASKTMKFTGKSKVRMRLSIWGGFPERRMELFSTTPEEQAQMLMMLRRRLLAFLSAPTSETGEPPAAAPAAG